MYVPKVSVPKPQHVFKIGKTFSWTKSDLQVESSSGTSKVLSVVSGALEETVDLNASFDITWFPLSTPSSKALKKKHSWEITQCFLFSTFSFIWVLKVITTVITAPYHFYFNVVPRRASNLREVRFGEVAVLKQISALQRKNLWKFSEYLFDLKFLVHMPQFISKLSLVLHFSIWATEGPWKNRPLSAVLFWQIFATICVCLSIAFFFSFFLSQNFWGSCYSSICFICGVFEFETWYVQNVSTFSSTFAIVSPLICVFWIQLTRTNAVFSKITLVSCFCAEIRLLGKILENTAKFLFYQKTHGARRRDGEGLGAWCLYWWMSCY
jgi:hypothetical protein